MLFNTGTFAENIGEKLKTLRQSKGLTQADLALVIGVSTSTITTWENGTRLVPLIAFDKIAKAFNLKPSQIFERIYPCPSK